MKMIKKISVLLLLFCSLFSSVVSIDHASAYGPITPPINYNETRVISTVYLSNSQVRALANSYKRNAENLSGIGIVIGLAENYIRGAGAVGGFAAIAGWLVNNFGSSFQSVADAGLGIKIVTYEKVHWDGYSPRIFHKYYTY